MANEIESDGNEVQHEKEEAVPSVFAALDAIASWSPLKRALLAASLFGAAFAIDVLAPRELSILGVYLIPIVVVAWCFPDPSAWVIEAFCGAGICAIEEVNAPIYSSTSLLTISVVFRGLFFAAVAIAAHDVKRAHRVLELRAERDPLTGLLNRRGFEKAARAEIERARRHHRPIALAFLDIDDFKSINDQKGHAAGDRILKLVGTTLLSGRKLDLVARVGGDEFVVLMPETSESGAQIAVERIRRSFQAAARSLGAPTSFTAGVAAFSRAPRHVAALIAEADRLLFQGKRTHKGSVRTRAANDASAEDPHPKGNAMKQQSIETAVLHAVAAHAELNANQVRLHQDFRRDLHMLPLDLVVIALTLEDEEHFEFPFERLADVRTVRDFANAARCHG